MFSAGQQVGHYTLIQKLGRGGFGEVWLAEKRTQFISKKVAVKLPFNEKIDFQAIQQEATLWEQASGHPNVLPIIDADVYDGQVMIVSEFAEGGSLDDKLKNSGKMPVKDAVEMTIGILNGLEYLHSKKIIHRDIKPANVLLQGGTPRLADFGVSRVIQTATHSSAIIGTDAYMSPEAFDGKRNVQTDIWSVGVLLYELLTGTLPFAQDHPTERMFAVLMKDFDPLPPEIPAALQKIVTRALTKNPEHRYQNAPQMRADLQQFLADFSSAKNSQPWPTVENQNLPTDPATTNLTNPNYQSAAQSLLSPQTSRTAQPSSLTQPMNNRPGRRFKLLLLAAAAGLFVIVSGVGLFFIGREFINSNVERSDNRTKPVQETNLNSNINSNTDTNSATNANSTDFNPFEMIFPSDNDNQSKEQATLKIMTASSAEEMIEALNGFPFTFEGDTAQLTWQSSSALVLAGNKLKELPADQKVEIGAHTNDQSTPAKNLSLSQSRANSIRKSLITFGLNGKSVVAKGYGDKMPINSGETEAERKKNCRIEFKLSSN